MKLISLAAIVGCLLAQGSDDPAPPSTDASKLGGTYSFVYYSNQSPNATLTTQLPCKNSTAFQLTFPDDESGTDVGRDPASSTKDPVYHTSQGDWTIVEVSKGNGFGILKMSLYMDDVNDIIACWAYKMQGHNIIANVNPRNLSECPTRYVPLTDTCTINRATLVGTCLSGACNGTTTSSRGFRPESSLPLILLVALSML